MASPSKAIVPAAALTPAELTLLLQEAGWAEKSSGDSLPRLRAEGATLVTPDGEMFVFNPKHPEIPLMTVRIVRTPEEYNGIYISERVASILGRPELANTFSKKYFDADPARRVWDSDKAYDEIRARTDILDDNGTPLKPSWKAEMEVQIVPEDGTLKGDEPVYALTLSTTSLIEFKGTSKTPDGGSVSEYNFIRKLSLFAIENAGTTDPRTAVLNALTSLKMGGVVAEIRPLRAENKERGQVWYVLSFTPIHIEPFDEGDKLLGPGDEENLAA